MDDSKRQREDNREERRQGRDGDPDCTPGSNQPNCNCNCSQLIKAAVEDLKDFLRQEIRISIHQALSDTALHGSLLGDDSSVFPSPKLLPATSADQANILAQDFDNISSSSMQPIHAQSCSMPFFYNDQSFTTLAANPSTASYRSLPLQALSDRDVLRMAQEASSRGNFCVLLMRAMFTTEERLRDTNCRGVKKPKFDESGERLEKIIQLAKKHFGPGDERLIRAEAYKRIDEANRRLRYQHNFSLYREAVHSTGNPEVGGRHVRNGESGME